MCIEISIFYWLSHAYFSKYLKRLRKQEVGCGLHPCISCTKLIKKIVFSKINYVQTTDNFVLYQILSINLHYNIFCWSCYWYAAHLLLLIGPRIFLNRLESRLWKVVQNFIQIYLSSSCIGGFYPEHLSGLSATSWIQKSRWWYVSNLLYNRHEFIVPNNASWQHHSWFAGCGKGCDCCTVHMLMMKMFSYTKRCGICRRFSWYQFQNNRPVTFSVILLLVLKKHLCPSPGTKAFSRESPCPTIYKNPFCLELFSCPTISIKAGTCPLLCHGSYCELIMSLARTSCGLSLADPLLPAIRHPTLLT